MPAVIAEGFEVETLEARYDKRARALLESIEQALAEQLAPRERGYVCDVTVQSDDDPRWVLTVQTHEDADNPDEYRGVDVTVQIPLSEAGGETSETSAAVSLDVVDSGGRIIGGCTPHNYTAALWIPLTDLDALDARFALLEGEGCDPGYIAEQIAENYPD
jgi:hypothetical protein